MDTSGKRDDIIRVALGLFAENGFHGTPMAMIAEKAGVGAGTIYRYFENKEVLIAELHRGLEEKVTALLLARYPEENPLRERFLYLMSEIIKYFIDHPLHFRYMEQFFNSPYGISLHRDRILGRSGKHDILMDIFKQGIEEQIFKELPKSVLFSLAFGPMVILIYDHIRGLIVLNETMIKLFTEACWDAVKR